MADYSDLTICVPAFNEASIVAETLDGLKGQFPTAKIITVNDGSTDATAQMAEAIPGVTVINHSRNMGYGASLKTAMRAANTSVVAWYDGDGQHDPKDLKEIVKPVLEGEKDAVIGVRAAGSDVSPDRLPGKILLKWAAQMVVRGQVPDLNSGLRAFRSDVIRKYLHLLPNGFSASSTSTLLMMKRGYRLGYISIMTKQRTGTSTVRILRDGLETMQLIFRILILFESFRFFTLLGLVQFVPAAIYGLYMALRLKGGLPTLSATVMISGVLTFFMGVICDQIIELRKERFEDYEKSK